MKDKIQHRDAEKHCERERERGRECVCVCVCACVCVCVCVYACVSALVIFCCRCCCSVINWASFSFLFRGVCLVVLLHPGVTSTSHMAFFLCVYVVKSIPRSSKLMLFPFPVPWTDSMVKCVTSPPLASDLSSDLLISSHCEFFLFCIRERARKEFLTSHMKNKRDLQGNPITSIADGAFNGLPNLKTL